MPKSSVTMFSKQKITVTERLEEFMAFNFETKISTYLTTLGQTIPVSMIYLHLCIIEVPDFTSFSEVSERQYYFSKYRF